MSLIITLRGRESTYRHQIEQNRLGFLPLISLISRWGSPDMPAGGRVTTHAHRCTGTHTHMTITTCYGLHMPSPGLTFAAKCCSGCLFMLRGLMVGAVQQVAALRCLSERRSGMITSWTFVCSQLAEAHANIHPTSVFLSFLCGRAPSPRFLCCEMPPDCFSLPPFFSQIYSSHLGTCRHYWSNWLTVGMSILHTH